MRHGLAGARPSMVTGQAPSRRLSMSSPFLEGGAPRRRYTSRSLSMSHGLAGARPSMVTGQMPSRILRCLRLFLEGGAPRRRYPSRSRSMRHGLAGARPSMVTGQAPSSSLRWLRLFWRAELRDAVNGCFYVARPKAVVLPSSVRRARWPFSMRSGLSPVGPLTLGLTHGTLEDDVQRVHRLDSC
jgi:hypothetical protein